MVFFGAKNSFYFTIFIIIGLLFPTFVFAQEESPFPSQFPFESYFVVSAYYSPLPDQTRYVTGSYEGDVRLNGEGVHAADGSLVYPGMIASSREFPFGTKIFIEGIGTGTVHDRGGAINGKRLDVWMGYGEEGMKRAMGWGMRNVKAKVFGIDPNIKEEIDVSKFPMASNVGWIRTRYFKIDLGFGDYGEEVGEMQRLFKDLGYDVDPTGIFSGTTRSAILAFQLERNIVPDDNDIGAGLFGPKTRLAFEQLLEAKKKELASKFPRNNLKQGSSGEDVVRLENFLKEMKLLDSADDAYDETTSKAVFQFQKSQHIVLSNSESGAGFFGPQTKEKFEEIMLARFTPDAERLKIPERTHSAAEAKTVIFRKDLAFGSRGEDVSRLQEELYRLHFLGVEPTGYFGPSTKHAVFKFQQAMGIVVSQKDSGAEVLGPRTREKLHQLIALREAQNRLIAEMTERKKTSKIALVNY